MDQQGRRAASLVLILALLGSFLTTQIRAVITIISTLSVWQRYPNNVFSRPKPDPSLKFCTYNNSFRTEPKAADRWSICNGKMTTVHISIAGMVSRARILPSTTLGTGSYRPCLSISTPQPCHPSTVSRAGRADPLPGLGLTLASGLGSGTIRTIPSLRLGRNQPILSLLLFTDNEDDQDEGKKRQEKVWALRTCTVRVFH